MTGAIYNGDCLDLMRALPTGTVDLFVTDPPYNIGYKYDVYQDTLGADQYVSWCRGWLTEANRVLAPTGSLYLIIGDEYQAELCCELKKLGLHWRNTIVWRYGFGQATKRKFARCHAMVHYFTKSATDFVFNADVIRVPSDRMIKYGDKRANPLGKVPDDVWDISRLCGTFQERIKDEDGSAHPCQLPEELLKRIVLASSNAGQVVLDPFCGTGTTAAVCHGHDRRWLTSDMSEKYCRVAAERLGTGTYYGGTTDLGWVSEFLSHVAPNGF